MRLSALVLPGVNDLDADPRSGGDDEGGIGQPGDAEGLIGPACGAGYRYQVDAGGGEGDGVRGPVDARPGRDLTTEPARLRGADPWRGPGARITSGTWQ